MPPRSERNVNVVFEPTACASYRGTVVIRPSSGQLERRDVAMVSLPTVPSRLTAHHSTPLGCTQVTFIYGSRPSRLFC